MVSAARGAAAAAPTAEGKVEGDVASHPTPPLLHSLNWRGQDKELKVSVTKPFSRCREVDFDATVQLSNYPAPRIVDTSYCRDGDLT